MLMEIEMENVLLYAGAMVLLISSLYINVRYS